jgi:hypothetical protein
VDFLPPPPPFLVFPKLAALAASAKLLALPVFTDFLPLITG